MKPLRLLFCLACPPERDFLAANDVAMHRMMAAMMVEPTGDVDASLALLCSAAHGVRHRPTTNTLLGLIRLGEPQPASFSPLYRGQVLVHGLGASPDHRLIAVVSIGSNSVTFIATESNAVLAGARARPEWPGHGRGFARWSIRVRLLVIHARDRRRAHGGSQPRRARQATQPVLPQPRWQCGRRRRSRTTR